MNNLLTAIMTKVSSSTLSSDVGGRVFLDEAPEGTEFPYIVFSVITSVPQDTFTEEIENTLVQFSLFSDSKGATEITGIYDDLKTLFKNAVLTITAGTNICLNQSNLVTMVDEMTTPAGTVGIKHWAIDYEIIIQQS